MGTVEATFSTMPTMTATVSTDTGEEAPRSSFSAERLKEPLMG